MVKENSPWYKLIIYGMEYFSRYYSNYRGFVVDNVDPKGLNRIKVIVPKLDRDNEDGLWAYPKGNWGGKNYGVNILPKIPIWSG